MGKKTASKGKNQVSYVEIATVGKKAGTKFNVHKGGIIPGLQTKGVKSAGKKKVFYTGNLPTAFHLHEASQAVEDIAPPAIELDPTPHEQETDLADKLVAEVDETGPDVRQLCETYELKREELGRLTGFSLRALAEWASGKLPSQPARRRLQEIRRLLDALAEIVKRERIPKWLHQPNPAFGRLTPLQIIELGEIDRLWAMVHDLASGQPD